MMKKLTGGISLDKKSVKVILEKIYEKYPRLEDWEYQELLYRTEISDAEVAVIMANAVMRAIDRIATDDDIPDWVAVDLRKKNYWIYSWHIDQDRLEDALSHLKDVCAYHHRQYGEPYELEYLLTWEGEFWQKVGKEYGKRKKKFYQKKFNWEEDID
jgi:hypothetical protein